MTDGEIDWAGDPLEGIAVVLVPKVPLLRRCLFPPAAVNANETRDDHAGIGVVCLMVFGFDLWIFVDRQCGCLPGALPLNVGIRAPTVAVVDRVHEFAIRPIPTVHHIHLFVLEYGQGGSLVAPVFSHWVILTPRHAVVACRGILSRIGVAFAMNYKQFLLVRDNCRSVASLIGCLYVPPQVMPSPLEIM